MANQPKILARHGHSHEGDWSSADETAQRVDTGRSFQLCSAEIQASDGQSILVRNETYEDTNNVGFFQSLKWFYQLKLYANLKMLTNELKKRQNSWLGNVFNKLPRYSFPINNLCDSNSWRWELILAVNGVLMIVVVELAKWSQVVCWHDFFCPLRL